MNALRFAVMGTGFWARYQLSAWRELPDVECIALSDVNESKAAAMAHEFRVPGVYSDAEELLAREKPDFVDIITNVETHSGLVQLAARYRTPVICQKPMASSIGEAEQMLATCRSNNVWFAVHENWRWQRPIRELKRALANGAIGEIFRARIDYCNSFPVFQNQPFLKELEQFILSDMGTHILDVARFLFGDVTRLYCQTHKVHADIRGEDAATVIMSTSSAATVTCNLSYASKIEHDRFPEVFVFVEGTRGSLELAPDFWIRETTNEGTHSQRYAPPFYTWADPRYELVHASIVECNRHLLRNLRSGSSPETSGADNLKTLKLVYAAYDSAAQKKAIVIT